MNILMLDEDRDSMPHFADLLEMEGNTVSQVATRAEFQQSLSQNSYDLLILDLMIPDPELSESDTDSGYTAGAFIYESTDRAQTQGIPFLVYSAAPLNASIISKRLRILESNSLCRGTFRKGQDDGRILVKIKSIRKEI